MKWDSREKEFLDTLYDEEDCNYFISHEDSITNVESVLDGERPVYTDGGADLESEDEGENHLGILGRAVLYPESSLDWINEDKQVKWLIGEKVYSIEPDNIPEEFPDDPEWLGSGNKSSKWRPDAQKH